MVASTQQGPAVHLALLGPVALRIGDLSVSTGPRFGALLGLLAYHAGEAVPVANIIDALWGDDRPGGAKATVQTHVSNARKALGPDRLRTTTGGYRLTLAPHELDVLEFRAHSDRGHHDVARGRLDSAEDELAAGLAAWRGVALSGIEAPFVDGLRRRLDHERLRVVELLARVQLAQERFDVVATRLFEEVARHPFRESLHGLLMHALYGMGLKAEALEVYQRLRDTLRDELGADPAPQVAQLHARILRDEQLGPPGTATLATAARSRFAHEHLPGAPLVLEPAGDGPPVVQSANDGRATISAWSDWSAGLL